MKRSLLIAALSTLLLTLFALPLAADTLVPIEGEAAPNEEVPTPVAPVTSYEACVAEALDPTTCDGVPVVPPVESCPLEGCEVIDTVPEEPQVNQAALMAAEEAASEAVADVVAEEPGVVDGTAAYIAALGAAREAARGAGADEETAEALAETAAVGAVAREAASDAASGDEGYGAVDGTAAYLAAIGAAREAGVSEESAPIAVGRAAAIRSDEEASNSEGAGSSGDETGASGDQTAKDEDSSDTGSAASAKDEASSAEGEASTAGEEEPFEAVSTALPTAEIASPLGLGAGAVLVVAGIVGLLIRRRLALQGSHEPEQQPGEEEASEEPSTVRRLPQRSVR